ncbi:MAG: hypothetical protein Q8876_09745 [Bacillota bacterium]|nr:hypothetical protein [Bacillota bacterium]
MDPCAAVLRFLQQKIKKRRRKRMTKKELSQLYYLKREIEQQQCRLEELQAAATSCTAIVTGLPKSCCISDKLAEYAVEIADFKVLVDLNLKRCFYELNRLSCYIQSVDVSQMRMILSLRYINGYSWRQIAFSIGGRNTEDIVRMAHYRFLGKNQ